jgi:hypothetical protein
MSKETPPQTPDPQAKTSRLQPAEDRSLDVPRQSQTEAERATNSAEDIGVGSSPQGSLPVISVPGGS